jgi:acetyl esterase/lipase
MKPLLGFLAAQTLFGTIAAAQGLPDLSPEELEARRNRYTAFTDLAYADRDAERNLLDIYIPQNAENPPIVMVIHGGGFEFGDKTAPAELRYYMDAGLAVASMNYRLSDTAQWPAQLEDLEDAFAFLRSHGAEYGYDASRIASFGASAGGHLSAVSGIAMAASEETALVASVVWFPPTLFNEMDNDAAAIGMTPVTGSTGDAKSSESRLIGAAVGENPELAAAASPIALLDALPQDSQLPAFLIMHGAEDHNIAYANSARLAYALLNRPGIDTLEYQLLPDSGHGSGLFQSMDVISETVDWLVEQFDRAK